jgi:hypothetical protein
MLLYKNMHILQMCKSKSALLTTLQMQMHLRLVYKLTALTNQFVDIMDM